MSMFNLGYKTIARRRLYKKSIYNKSKHTNKTFDQLSDTVFNYKRLEPLTNYSPYKYRSLAFNLNKFLELNLLIDNLYISRETIKNKKIGYYHKGV